MADILSLIPEHLREEAAAALAADPTLQQWLDTQDSFWANFIPRPDKPEEFDQQASFCLNRDPVAFLVGGNASGTTEAAAKKTADFLLRQQPPPRENTPFWVISDTYEQVTEVCWAEKLHGHGHIPDCEIDWNGIRWRDSKLGLPYSVPLKPWPGRPGKNWHLQFKSYKQGRRAMQAKSIGGFWFSEQFPLSIFLEVLRGCREYMFPGGQFAEFTPIDPELCMWVEKIMDKPPAGWKFYRCNTACNKGNLAEGWFDQFFATVPDELMQTRMIGSLANFVGLIYPSFNPAVHVQAAPIVFPPGVTHMRAIDWGASEEHPFAMGFGYQDGMGDWFIYDEYWSADQTKITMDHAVEALARSIFWGWPAPEHVVCSTDKILIRFTELVLERLEEISPDRADWLRRFMRKPEDTPFVRPSDHWGYTYGDPSRPGEMVSFTRYGIQMAPASNDVYEGINCVRALLKINPYTEKPRVYIHPRCQHLVEELRKYRWEQGRQVSDGTTLNPRAGRPVPLKRHDDSCDWFRYLCFSPTRYTKETPDSIDQRLITQQRKSIQLDTGPGRWRLTR